MLHRRVNWERYARDYDRMAGFNPAYQQLIARFQKEIADWRFTHAATLVDLGAGTGNFSIPLARQFPDCRVVHIDACQEMNDRAREKAQACRVANLDVRTADVGHVDFPRQSVAAVISVNALYAFPDAPAVLARVSAWLQPEGEALFCDVGRSLPVTNWARYLLREGARRHGFLPTLGHLRHWGNIAIQNRRIALTRRNGQFWNHTLDEFRQCVEAAGFHVREAFHAYRDTCDVVLANKR